MYWFVLRDFKKFNAKQPAYRRLPELGVEVFTPMHWVVTTFQGKKTRIYRPIIPNLLFAHTTRQILDPIIARESSLQYQFRRGGRQGEPMTVPDADMQRFITAVNSDPQPIYFSPEEITPEMIGRKVEITGGPLNGFTGKLLKMRGTRKRRLIVQLQGYVAAAIEVNPDLIRLLD